MVSSCTIDSAGQVQISEGQGYCSVQLRPRARLYNETWQVKAIPLCSRGEEQGCVMRLDCCVLAPPRRCWKHAAPAPQRVEPRRQRCRQSGRACRALLLPPAAAAAPAQQILPQQAGGNAGGRRPARCAPSRLQLRRCMRLCVRAAPRLWMWMRSRWGLLYGPRVEGIGPFVIRVPLAVGTTKCLVVLAHMPHGSKCIADAIIGSLKAIAETHYNGACRSTIRAAFLGSSAAVPCGANGVLVVKQATLSRTATH